MRRTWIAIGTLGALAACGPAVTSNSGSGDDGGTSTDAVTTDTPEPGSTGGSTGSVPSTGYAETTGDASSSSSGDPEWLDDARVEYPTFRAFYDKYLERTCTPFDNVCHSSHDSPDLSEPEDYVAAFEARCHHIDPAYDGCEPVGDPIRIVSGPDAGWSSEIGWLELTDETLRVSPRTPPPAGEALTIAVESDYFGREWIELESAVAEGTLITAPATALSDLQRGVLQDIVRQGDPNRNGTFGADDPHALLRSGDPERSLIFLGLRGEVSGLPLPLSSPAADLPDLAALGCWIEQIGIPADDDIDAPIDYDNCTLVLP